MLEHRTRRDHQSGLARSAHQLDRHDAVAPERKEIVVDPNPLQPQNLRKQRAQYLLGALRGSRRTAVGVTSGAGSARRSSKLDRRALPAPEVTPTPVRRLPRTGAEEVLCALFAQVLGLERVGIDDNFFALGGDSIMSIQLVSRARKAGLVITPRAVFQHQTVAALAPVAKPLTEPTGGRSPSDLALVALTPGELDRLEGHYPQIDDILPLSPLQEGLLFHALYDAQAPDVLHHPTRARSRRAAGWRSFGVRGASAGGAARDPAGGGSGMST